MSHKIPSSVKLAVSGPAVGRHDPPTKMKFGNTLARQISPTVGEGVWVRQPPKFYIGTSGYTAGFCSHSAMVTSSILWFIRFNKGAPHSPPQFLAHVCCGETAVCIRIPLATEVGLSLGDIMLDGDPAPPPLKGYSPQFSVNVRCGETAGWTKMPIGMEVGLGPGDVVLDGVTVPPKRSTAPSFRPMSIVVTVAHLSYC